MSRVRAVNVVDTEAGPPRARFALFAAAESGIRGEAHTSGSERGAPRPRARSGTAVAVSQVRVTTRAGVAVWSAATASEAVPAWGSEDDDAGCAGPAASPARPWRPSLAPPAGGLLTRWRSDIERLNRILRSGLTFSLEPEVEAQRPGCRRGGLPHAGGLREDEPARARGSVGEAGRARGVLLMVCEDGRHRSATCSVPITGSERRRRLSISRGLSECAMALGLGTGVYRGRR